MMFDLPRKAAAEALATALLMAVVIGSAHMGDRLAGGNAALALLVNTLATVGGLYILIELFAPISGAHLNPAVSAVMAWRGELPLPALLPYACAQVVGAVLGVWLVHAMFDLPLLQWSAQARDGAGLWLSELVATAGLLLVALRAPAGRLAAMVAAYIGAAYWFTASTGFANPAGTLARMFTGTVGGIAPSSAVGYMGAEFVGAAVGMLVHRALEPRARRERQAGAIGPAGVQREG